MRFPQGVNGISAWKFSNYPRCQKIPRNQTDAAHVDLFFVQIETDLSLSMLQDDSWSSSSLTVVKFNDLNYDVDLQWPAYAGSWYDYTALKFNEDKQSIQCVGYVGSTYCMTVTHRSIPLMLVRHLKWQKCVQKYVFAIFRCLMDPLVAKSLYICVEKVLSFNLSHLTSKSVKRSNELREIWSTLFKKRSQCRSRMS